MIKKLLEHPVLENEDWKQEPPLMKKGHEPPAEPCIAIGKHEQKADAEAHKMSDGIQPHSTPPTMMQSD